ncbi:hypothetical protein CEUSTIGMA_g10159.t1 [Chlamydomonas eustigma]|uniref:Replication factor A protein 3 n=1 Tax=Chlamydomonas eustigma TaxID=1157962 RepID=A0A250XI62_9CHLO|nr:hypothetical protein CEUSTIGMA_g10159.t1 [Chlamydomonas eustigma]|eukprot:GAX82733.1 hypothetical protein CEUSTIGMA_g10159.t1 [Chlamydomonas eustigma]
MEDIATPSINAELMIRYVGRRVRVVCELDNAGDGQTVQGRTSDKGVVQIQRDPRTAPPKTKYVEFIGTVVDPQTIREESNTNWGDNFDMAMHNESVHLMNSKYAWMFQQA